LTNVIIFVIFDHHLKIGGFMAKGYGSDEFLNKISELLGHRYDKEISILQHDNVTLQQSKLQSIILLEILAELRGLASKQELLEKPVAAQVIKNLKEDYPKESERPSLPGYIPPTARTVPVPQTIGSSSAPDLTKRT